MLNRDIEAAWRYHNGTKLSWEIVNTVRHELDWNNQPLPFKIYPQLEGEELPRDISFSSLPVPADSPTRVKQWVPRHRDLARLLYFSAGITRRRTVPGGEIYFRAAACTGALYHIEVYLVCGNLPDLPAGVYHFGPHDFTLRRLRAGDYRGVLVEASGGQPAVSGAPAVVVTTSVYWRNSWKSQARAYRHAYWDSGTILGNLLAVGAANEIPLKLITAFVDGPVNRLLDLDDRQEAALQLVPVGMGLEETIPPPPEVTPLGLEVTAYSSRPVEYPAITEMHAASSLQSADQVKELWGNPPPPRHPRPQGIWFPLAQDPEAGAPTDTPIESLKENPGQYPGESQNDSIASVVLRRGSSRRFRRAPISHRQLSTTLEQATRALPADYLDGRDDTLRPGPAPGLTQLYLIVHDVEGMPPGSYVFDQERAALEQLKPGNFRDQAAYLGLQQALAADASVNAFFLADLESVLDRYGNRGYRMAQVEAGIRGGWIYLAAYAQGLGASGLTFLDDEVTEFFSPHAAGKSVMFFIALGHPRHRPRSGATPPG